MPAQEFWFGLLFGTILTLALFTIVAGLVINTSVKAVIANILMHQHDVSPSSSHTVSPGHNIKPMNRRDPQ